jgi:hypothetical protein
MVDMTISAWTTLDVTRLREFYEQYPADQPIPIADIAAVLGRPPQAVRSKAHKLGLSQSTRPRGNAINKRLDTPTPTPCPTCGAMFQPRPRGQGWTRTCSRSCATRLQYAEGGHPRGMAGKRHTDETKAAVGAGSRRSWAESPPERRTKAAERLIEAQRSMPVSENTYTRGRGGKRADLDNQYFRSSWEANYARWLNYRRDVARDLTSWEYEPIVFEFPVKHGTTSYRPDFRLTFPDGRIEWHEVKGWLTPRGATALKRFAKYYPDEVLVLIDAEPYQAIARFARAVIPTWETGRETGR